MRKKFEGKMRKKTDAQIAGLKGKVKTLERSHFKAEIKGGKVEKGSLDNKHMYAYDDRGNQIEWKVYNSNRSLNLKHTYAYDDKGNKIEWKSYKDDGSLEAKYVFKYKYDSEGNWIEVITFQVKSEGGKREAKEIKERKITYY